MAAASLVTLLLRAIWVSKPFKRLRGFHEPNDSEHVESAKGFIDRVGGTTIFVLKFARLDGVLALLALMVYSGIRDGWSCSNVALAATMVRLAIFFLSWSLITLTRRMLQSWPF